MEINKIMNLENRMADFEKRDLAIIKLNKDFAIELEKQNVHIENLVKGYVALGIVAPDNGEMIEEQLTTREVFLTKRSDLEIEYQYKNSLILNQTDKFESKKIEEEFISKMIDLIATRWESIIATIALLRTKRFESRDEIIKLVRDNAELVNTETDNWKEKGEVFFKKYSELLDYQEKYLQNEETLMNELKELLSMRAKLIVQGDKTFLE